MENLAATPETMTQEKKNSLLEKVLNIICDIFSPLLPLMTTVGLLKGILAMLASMNVLSAEGGTYTVLYNIADAFFYYLPVFLAFSASQKFKVNIFASVTVALFTVHPTIVAAIAGDTLTFLGWKVPNVTYSSSIIPMLLAIFCLIYLEKLEKKVLPELLEGILGPLFSLVILVPLTLFVLGPIGSTISNGIASGYNWLYQISPIVAGIILGALIQPMVSLGLHWGLIPIAINNIATTGSDTILSLVAPAAFAVMGVSLATWLRAKDKKLKVLAFGAAISAICGETSPALFGVLVPYRKTLLFTSIVGGIGGAVIGATGGAARSFAMQSVLTLPIYMGPGFTELLITCGVAAVAGFVLVTLFGYESRRELNGAEAQ